MLERTALLKLLPEFASPEAQRALVARALEVLRPLPGVQAITVGTAADDPTRADWDVSITVRFASLADAAVYRSHPDHRRFVDEYVAPRCAKRQAWSFAIETR